MWICTPPHPYLYYRLIVCVENYINIGVGVLSYIAFLSIIVYILHMSQTYQPNKRKRAKTHGFLVRAKTAGGKKVTQARRQKGRAKVSIAK